MYRRTRIDLSWLIKLRWAAVGGQLVTIVFVRLLLGIELPLAALFTILAVVSASNVLLEIWFRRRASTWEHEPAGAEEAVLGGVLIMDVLFLGALLYWTGGAANPFSSFYLVHITLAAILLRPPWAWGLALVAFGSHLALFFQHVPLPALEDEGWRLQGVVVSLATTTGITVVFVTRVKRELAEREEELRKERERIARRERIEALATLATGAAHELASPLSTIAVVAKELERELETDDEAGAVRDARLIRQEVKRCREILDRMHHESGGSAGEELVASSVEDLLREALVGLPEAQRVDLEVSEAAARLELHIPMRGLGMALRGIVKNAMDASPEDARVRLGAALDSGALVLRVQDRGEGMDAEVVRRALDPFFTTKDPGRGMGLGLFLASSVVERLGGEVGIDSQRGMGTTVSVRIPLESVA